MSKATASWQKIRDSAVARRTASCSAAATRRATATAAAPTMSSRRSERTSCRRRSSAGRIRPRLIPTRQAWEMTRAGGHLITLGLPRGTSRFPPGPGQTADAFTTRSVRRRERQGRRAAVREAGRSGAVHAKAMVTATYPLDRTREAFQAVGDRRPRALS